MLVAMKACMIKEKKSSSWKYISSFIYVSSSRNTEALLERAFRAKGGNFGNFASKIYQSEVIDYYKLV